MCKFTASGFNIRNGATPIHELQNKLVVLADRCTEITDKADSEGRQMTKDEMDVIEQSNSDFEAITAEIQQRERVDAMHRATNEPVNRQAMPPHMPPPADAPGNGGFSDPRAVQHRRSGIILNQQNRGNASRLLLPQNAADPWKRNSDAFFVALANGIAHPALMQNAYGSEGSGSDGGFAVPPAFYSGIIDQAMQRAELAPRCRLFSTPSAGLTLPMPDVSDRSADIAGINAGWVAEGATMTSQAMQWTSVEVKLDKIGIVAAATSELASDGLNFAAQLEQKMSEAAALALDFAILSGSGVNRPLGLTNSGGAVAVAPESGQAAGTILFQNVVALFSRVAPSSQMNGVWFVSPSVVSQLIMMTFPTGGGTSIPVMLGNGSPTNAATGAPIGSILGRPVVVSEVCSQLGQPGDICFADLSKYALVLRQSARIEIDRSLGFASDKIHWRLILRVGGCPMHNALQVPYAGGSSLGWASYLQARV